VNTGAVIEMKLAESAGAPITANEIGGLPLAS
jgi:hypothetical protein